MTVITLPPFPEERVIQTAVSADESGMRLDVWLARRFTYNSRHRWQKCISAGQIRLNGRLVRASRILNTADQVVFVPPAETEEPPVDPAIRIIYEDPELVVVDKSGNLPSHPAGAYFKHTLWSFLKPRFGNLHIVTRLDRETSGLVLCSPLSQAAGALAGQFAGDAGTEKVYYALVHGQLMELIAAVGYLSKDPVSKVIKKRRFTEKHPGDDAEGVETAETRLRPISCSKYYTLVEAIPVTGRLHQIRATLCSLGFPLVGDKIYGVNDHFYLKFITDQLSNLDFEILQLKRQALHAAHLKFRHPRTNSVLTFDIPLPDDIFSLCQKYELSLPPELIP